MAKTSTNTTGGTRARDAAAARKSAAATKKSTTKSTKAKQPAKKAAAPVQEDYVPARRQPMDSSLKDEIIAIVALLFSVLLVLSYVDLCGSLGNILNYAVFGLFGAFGYVFPFALFFIVLFCISNKRNKSIVNKAFSCFFMLAFITAIVQMAIGGFDPEIGIIDYFTNSVPGYDAVDKTYGGLFGGLICKLLVPYVGEIAAICIMIAAVLVFFVLVAGKAIFTSLTRKGIDKARQSRLRRMQYEDEYYEEDDQPIDYPPHGPGVNRPAAMNRRPKKLEPSEKFDEEAFLENIDNPKSEKVGFIDGLMRRGMGISTELITETPEYKELAEELSEYQSPEVEVEPRNIADAELIKKFGDDTEADKLEVPHFIERSRINEVRNNRTYMVDEEPEAEEPAYKEPRYKESAYNESSYEASAYKESVYKESEYDSEEHNQFEEDDSSAASKMSNVVSLSSRIVQNNIVELKNNNQMDYDDSLDANADSATVDDEQTEDEGQKVTQDRTSSGAVCFTDMSQAYKQEEKKIPPYVFPPIDLLNKPSGPAKGVSKDELTATADRLQKTFESFGVGVKVTDATCGPTVTRYELTPDQGVKVKTITSLADDIKLALAAADIRIEAPIPGKAAVGIEVPNSSTSPVLLRELIDSPEFKDASSNLTFAVGKDIGGKTICFNIASMPHMLIAGATGSGKSVCINSLIMSIIYKAKPSDVKMIMIDPKRVELIGYNGIPHLLVPVVTDVKKASGALNWAIAEMDDRYSRFADNGVNNLASYNHLMEERYYEAGNEGECPDRLPQIVIIVDELNDLMMTANGKEVEASICRLTQLARASGIHVVLATQRPSVNVITGTIKANIPSRIAFSVSSVVDSRTILDQAGAEKLLGKGDMLFFPQGYSKPVRLQGAFVSDREVNGVVDFIKSKCKEVKYNELISKHIDANAAGESSPGKAETDDMAAAATDDRDEFYEAAGKFIIEKQKASIGMLQRMYRIGFNRAARIMDQLAEDGVVGPEEGTKPRRIIMNLQQFEAFLSGASTGADSTDSTSGLPGEQASAEISDEY